MMAYHHRRTGELGSPLAVSAGRGGQGRRWLRECLISAFHPLPLYFTVQSPGP